VIAGSGSARDEFERADAWSAENRGLLTACFEAFSATGEWPQIEALEHRFEVAGEDIDVGLLGWQMPRPLGFAESGRIVLLCRALLAIPEARPLLDAWFEAVQYAYQCWLGDPKGELNSHEIVALLEGDERKARLVSKLLFRESWLFGSGHGLEDGYWSRELISAVRIARDAPDAAGLIEARANLVAKQVPPSIPITDEQQQIIGPAVATVGESAEKEHAGKIKRTWHYVTANNYLAAVLAAITMVLLGGLYVVAHQILYPGGGKTTGSKESGAAEDTRTPAEKANRSRTAQSGTIVEYADSHAGSPVFASREGAPVAGSPGRIPYGTSVSVTCFAPNETGMASVSGLYLIASGHWRGDFVVSDTMTNGGPLGTTTTPNLDPRVAKCAAAANP
jgi:hypothetical protein